MLDAVFAVMHKTRLGPEQVSVTEVTGRVHGKICIVGDDVTTTGGTLIAGARALREHGASEVWVYVTHALLSPDGLTRLAGAEDISGIVVTDTVPIDPREQPENLTVLTVAPLLAETIVNVFSDDSVSAIFGGENQLF
jgi:ribose-phosphate pyrophosphokinase